MDHKPLNDLIRNLVNWPYRWAIEWAEVENIEIYSIDDTIGTFLYLTQRFSNCFLFYLISPLHFYWTNYNETCCMTFDRHLDILSVRSNILEDIDIAVNIFRFERLLLFFKFAFFWKILANYPYSLWITLTYELKLEDFCINHEKFFLKLLFYSITKVDAESDWTFIVEWQIIY